MELDALREQRLRRTLTAVAAAHPFYRARWEAHLRGREFLLEEFSIADAYLATILNWAQATQVDLQQWPVVHEYHQRMLEPLTEEERAMLDRLIDKLAGEGVRRIEG